MVFRVGQIVELIQLGGSPLTNFGAANIGDRFTVIADESVDTGLVEVRNSVGQETVVLARRFRLVRDEAGPGDRYVIFNATTNRVIGWDEPARAATGEYYTYDQAVERCRRYFRAVNGGNRGHTHLHIVPLRSITLVTLNDVTDYRENQSDG